MGRPERIRGDDLYYHVILRCNNGERMFASGAECAFFLEHLKRYADQYKCEVHNYTIMPSHVHLMLMTTSGNHVDIVLRDICSCTARSYNKRRTRSGHFWRHRFRSKIITDDAYALACLRYNHRNPLAGGVVKNLDEWKWSAYHYYARGMPDEIIKPLPTYLNLGSTDTERRERYVEVIADPGAPAALERGLFEGRFGEGTYWYERARREVNAAMFRYIYCANYKRVPGT